MVSGLKVILGVVLVLTIGCVEVRDKEESAPVKPMVRVQSQSRLVIDEEVYLLNGQFLTAPELELELRQAPSSLPVEELEFHFGEAILGKNAVINTLGHRVRLHIDRLESDGARIQTWPQQFKPQPQQPGRHGGHVFLDVASAKGSMRIQMIGQDGGQGQAGAGPSESMKGAAGTNGAKGLCNHEFAAKAQGQDGAQGLKGYAGGNGARGGDSGTLEINIGSGSEFHLDHYRRPGHGGVGGAGGKGGPGGPGGSPGILSPIRPMVVGSSGSGPKMDAARTCNHKVSAGKPGPEGETGDRGQDGETGVAQTICITRDEATSCF